MSKLMVERLSRYRNYLIYLTDVAKLTIYTDTGYQMCQKLLDGALNSLCIFKKLVERPFTQRYVEQLAL